MQTIGGKGMKRMKLFTEPKRPKKPRRPEDYKILLVEDGSIDVDSLEQFIDEHDLKIKIVVYRAGSIPPCLLNQQGNELWRR